MSLRTKILYKISPTYREIIRLSKRPELSKRYGVFVQYTLGYKPDFKTYLIQNNMPERINQLKEGLDDVSKEVIDHKIEHFLHFPLGGGKYGPHFLADTRDILYTEEEMQENKKYLKALPLIKKKYKGYFGPVYLPEVFFYHHGLKFLPQSVLDYIKGKDFIDVGAYYGDSSVVMQEYHPHKVWAFELFKALHQKYIQNQKVNNISDNKYELVAAGVADKESTVKIDDREGGNIANSGEVDAQIITLDNFFKDKNARIGWLKMDIEGGEDDAIEGAVNILQNNRPLITVTIYHTPRQFFELKPRLETILPNYKFMVRNLNFYHFNELETTLIAIPAEAL